MTLTGPQKIPFASTAYWYGSKYPGNAMESNVGVLHTTEGTTLPDYGGGASAPNITGLPDIPNKKIKWYQHFDVDRSSRALVNASGGVETNTLNAFQAELVGTCDPSHRTSWGSRKAGVDYIYWPDAPDWALREVAVLVAWLHDNHGFRNVSTVTFKPYPASYGSGNGVRLTGAQWSNYYGWLGHQHVPENLHGDPGDIDIAKILAYASGSDGQEEWEVADFKTELIAALKDEEVRKLLVKALFQTDNVLENPNPDNAPTNPYVYAYSLMKNAEVIGRRIDRNVQALSVGGVDLDALADKVADKLAERLRD